MERRRTQRVISFFRERIGGRLIDWRFGVRTEAFFDRSALSLPAGGIAYHPSDWFSLRRAITTLRLGANDVFVDYGCGLGRALISAGRWPCKRVLGLEYSELLVARARENISAARKHLRCAGAEVVQGDARLFQLPDDATVAYFYNPFGPDVLAEALDRIRHSLAKAPRPFRILYRHPHHFEALATSRPWLRKLADYPDLGPHRYVVYAAG